MIAHSRIAHPTLFMGTAREKAIKPTHSNCEVTSQKVGDTYGVKSNRHQRQSPLPLALSVGTKCRRVRKRKWGVCGLLDSTAVILDFASALASCCRYAQDERQLFCAGIRTY